MKWPWKVFALQLAALFLFSTLTAYCVGKYFEFKSRKPTAEKREVNPAGQMPAGPSSTRDPTVLSMIIGCSISSVAFAFFGGWRGWKAGPMISAVAIISIVFAGTLGVVITLLAAAGRWSGGLGKAAWYYHFSARETAGAE